jgi:hypothetical protein
LRDVKGKLTTASFPPSSGYFQICHEDQVVAWSNG